MIPEVVSGIVLECAQLQCGFVIHQPNTIAAILLIQREEQPDHIVIGYICCGMSNQRILQESADRIDTITIDAGGFFSAANAFCKFTRHMCFNVKTGISSKILG